LPGRKHIRVRAPESSPFPSGRIHARIVRVEMLTNGQVLAERYQVTGSSGRRGAEVLYTATDLRRKTPVTIREVGVEDEAAWRALESEARLLIELRHSSLPFVLDDFNEGQRLYLVTEFIGEESLAERMSRADGPLPVEEVLNWAWELLDVLEYLHGLPQPILHRCVEPSNIYVGDGRVFLIGLGSASQDGGQQSAQARVAYVQAQPLGFASPEQIRGLAATPACDFYSLAATLYFLLTNVVPDDALQRALSLPDADTLEPIEAHRPSLDAHVARAVTAGLALGAKRRPQSAREMRDLLFREEPDAPKPRRGVARALTAAGLLAALALLAGTALYFSPPPCDKIPAFVSQRVTLPCLKAAAPDAPRPEPQRPPADAAAAAKARSDELAAEAAERLQRGDYDGARLKADESLKENKDNVYAQAIKCDADWDTEHEAAEYETASQLRRVPEVTKCAERIIALVALVKEPRTAENQAALAWAHTALEKYPAAIAHADKALALKQDLVMAHMMRAVAVLGGGAAPQEPLYQSALANLREVLRLRPDYPQAHYLRARVLFSRELFADAEEEAEKASRHRPQAKSFILLGDISKRYGDMLAKQNQSAKADEKYGRAAELYNRALGANPNFAPAYMKLAQLHYGRQKWGDALDVIARGLEVRKDDAALHDLKGQTYLALNNAKMAMPECERAVELDPKNAVFLANRAKCYEAMEAVQDEDETFADKD
jgi:tetratricopeptide (TPR) repeat protein